MLSHGTSIISGLLASMQQVAAEASSNQTAGILTQCIDVAYAIEVAIGDIIRHANSARSQIISQLLSAAAAGQSVEQALAEPLALLNTLVAQSADQAATEIMSSIRSYSDAITSGAGSHTSGTSLIEGSPPFVVDIADKMSNADTILDAQVMHVAAAASTALETPLEMLTALLQSPATDGPVAIRKLYALMTDQQPVLLRAMDGLLQAARTAAASGHQFFPAATRSSMTQLYDLAADGEGQGLDGDAHGATSIRQLLRQTSQLGEQLPEIPSNSSFHFFSSEHTMGHHTGSGPAALCYAAAASATVLGPLLLQHVPSVEDVFLVQKRAFAMVLAFAADNGADWIGDLLMSPGAIAIFPEFAQIWATRLREGSLAATASDLLFNATVSGHKVSVPDLSDFTSDDDSSPESRLRKARLAQGVLVAAGDDMRATSAEGTGGTSTSTSASAADLVRQRLQKLALGSTHPQYVDTTVDTSSPVHSFSFDWAGNFALNALQQLGGATAPPATKIVVSTGTRRRRMVDTVELTAPLVGYGATQSGRIASSSSAFQVPPKGVDASGPHLQTCADFGFMHAENLEQGLSGGIWQPNNMIPFNWLLDSDMNVDNTHRTFCPIEQPAGGAVSFSATDRMRFGRAGLSRLDFDEAADNATLVAISGASASPGLSFSPIIAPRLKEKVISSCPRDPIATMRTEVMAICRESFIASNQPLPFTDGFAADAAAAPSAFAPPLDSLSATPHLIVRDQFGRPFAGRNCTIEVSEISSLFAPSPYKVSYECGPSDADGVIALRHIAIDGGGSAKLKLVVKVDDVEAVPSASSPWRFDTALFYVSTEQPNLGKALRLLLGSKGSVHLLVLASLFALALNAVSLRLQRTERAPMPLRILGLLGLLWLVEINASLFLRTVGNTKSTGQLTLIGMFDMFASRQGRTSLGHWILILLTLAISLKILVTQTLLFYGTMNKRYSRAWVTLQADLEKSSAGPLLRRSTSKVKEFYQKPIDTSGKALKGATHSFLSLKDKVAGVSRTLRRFTHGVTPVQDGQIELPVRGETHAERRQRCARNYVRKLLRGRGWVRGQLLREQELINKYPWTGKLRSFFFGMPRKVATHLPYERSGDFFFPERLQYAFVLSMWLQIVFSLVVVYMASFLSAGVGRVYQVVQQMQVSSTFLAIACSSTTHPMPPPSLCRATSRVSPFLAGAACIRGLHACVILSCTRIHHSFLSFCAPVLGASRLLLRPLERVGC